MLISCVQRTSRSGKVQLPLKRDVFEVMKDDVMVRKRYLSLSLSLCARRACVCVCACVRVCTCVCVCVCVCERERFKSSL